MYWHWCSGVSLPDEYEKETSNKSYAFIIHTCYTVTVETAWLAPFYLRNLENMGTLDQEHQMSAINSWDALYINSFPVELF